MTTTMFMRVDMDAARCSMLTQAYKSFQVQQVNQLVEVRRRLCLACVSSHQFGLRVSCFLMCSELNSFGAQASLKAEDSDEVAIVGCRCSMIDSCVGVVPCGCFQSASLRCVAWILAVPILIGKVQQQSL